MEILVIGYIMGCTSVIAIWVFFNARRKKGTAGTLEERIDRNNTDIRSGLDRSEAIVNSAREVNTGIGNINRSAIEGIENTESAISKIIADSIRNEKTEPKG